MAEGLEVTSSVNDTTDKRVGLTPTGAPPREFWEDDLETGVDHIHGLMSRNGHVDDWIRRRTGRQIDMLHRALGLDGNGSTQRKKETLRSCGEEQLFEYLLVERFAQYKSKVAVADFAAGVLDPDLIEVCQKGEDDFDTAALLIAIYDRAWPDLRLVFHLDKVHKTGFARMVLQQKARHPSQTFGDFLKPAKVREVLARFDASRRDGLTSEFKDVISRDGRHLVFVRRANRPDYLVKPRGGVMHGYRINPSTVAARSFRPDGRGT
jgi:hypothetical protein